MQNSRYFIVVELRCGSKKICFNKTFILFSEQQKEELKIIVETEYTTQSFIGKLQREERQFIYCLWKIVFGNNGEEISFLLDESIVKKFFESLKCESLNYFL